MLSCSSDDDPYPFISQTQTDSYHQMFKNEQRTVQPYHSHLADPFFEDDDLFLNYSTHHHLLGGNTCQDLTDISIEVSHIAAGTNNGSINDTEIGRDTSVKSSSEKKGTTVKQTIQRNKSGKKDRHSKICTAQGTRDRRMRLSLPVARKFFDLHDLLGFDKASKTIEWLFSKSRSAIREVEQKFSRMKQYTLVAAKSLSSTTENEVVQRVGVAAESSGFKKYAEEKLAACLKDKKFRKLRTVAKESRDMARARARVRAREKMILKGVGVSSKGRFEVMPSGETYTGNQGKSVTLKAIPGRSDEEANDHGFLEHYMNSVDINENGSHCLLSPSSAFKIPHDEDPGGVGNNDDDIFSKFYTELGD